MTPRMVLTLELELERLSTKKLRVVQMMLPPCIRSNARKSMVPLQMTAVSNVVRRSPFGLSGARAKERELVVRIGLITTFNAENLLRHYIAV